MQPRGNCFLFIFLLLLYLHSIINLFYHYYVRLFNLLFDICSIVHLFICLFLCSVVCLFNCSFYHSIILLITCLKVHSLVNSFVEFVCLFIRSFFCLLVCSFVGSFVPSFVPSFVQSISPHALLTIARFSLSVSPCSPFPYLNISSFSSFSFRIPVSHHKNTNPPLFFRSVTRGRRNAAFMVARN